MSKNMSVRARIERVYLRLTSARTPHGAGVWFAKQARVAPNSVSRWIQGRRKFGGPAAKVLEMLEESAGLSPETGSGE